MNDPLLVSMLDGMADLDEQLQSVGRSRVVRVAVFGDRNAADQFHDEVRPAGVGGAGIEDLAIFG